MRPCIGFTVRVYIILEKYPINPLYPPAYPLVLAFGSFLSPTDPIKGMIIANIAIVFATLGFGFFNLGTGLAGLRFAWDDPFVRENTNHARAITAIIGDRRADPRPALVSVDSDVLDNIEANTGIRPNRWPLNLVVWSGRDIAMTNASENGHSGRPHYRISLANSESDPATVYQVSGVNFQVIASSPSTRDFPD